MHGSKKPERDLQMLFSYFALALGHSEPTHSSQIVGIHVRPCPIDCTYLCDGTHPALENTCSVLSESIVSVYGPFHKT